MTRPARSRPLRLCMRNAERPNLFIKIPGTKAGVPAIEESIFEGVPINVTLLFSSEQYSAAAEAYRRGIERRIGRRSQIRHPIGCVAFCQPVGCGCRGQGAQELRDRLGIAIAQQTYKTYRQLLDSPRWQRIFNAGARPQRLLWASTGTDPNASDVLYVESFMAPLTINTLTETTLKAFADHGQVDTMMLSDGGDSEAILTQFAEAGIDTDALAGPAAKRRNRIFRQVVERTDRIHHCQGRRP